MEKWLLNLIGSRSIEEVESDAPALDISPPATSSAILPDICPSIELCWHEKCGRIGASEATNIILSQRSREERLRLEREFMSVHSNQRREECR